MLITVIGRGHSGTRSMSQTLSDSGVYMGEPLNESWDLLPPEAMYDACREFAKYVRYEGSMKWDFSKVLEMEPTEKFKALINEYLVSVLSSDAENKGWKIPETTLCFPWIAKMFPDIKYIYWVRDPRDCILNFHITDDLSRFGVDYDHTDDERLRRAISWKYQWDIMHVTPRPKNTIDIRFEDMVMDQDNTLKRLEEYLGIPMAKIEMRKSSVGRYKTDTGVHTYDFFDAEIEELGYEKE